MLKMNNKETKAELIARLYEEANGNEFDLEYIAEAIKFRQSQYELNGNEMSFILRITKGKYSEIINAKRVPSKNVIFRLVAIGVPSSVFFNHK